MYQNSEDPSSRGDRYYLQRHAVCKRYNITSHTLVVLVSSCGVFIPDKVLAGWWRSQWKASDRMWAGRCTTVCGRGQVYKCECGWEHCSVLGGRKGDIRRVHNSGPTRTYIPAPFHNLLCTYPPTSGHSPSIDSSTSLPEPCKV